MPACLPVTLQSTIINVQCVNLGLPVAMCKNHNVRSGVRSLKYLTITQNQRPFSVLPPLLSLSLCYYRLDLGRGRRVGVSTYAMQISGTLRFGGRRLSSRSSLRSRGAWRRLRHLCVVG